MRAKILRLFSFVAASVGIGLFIWVFTTGAYRFPVLALLVPAGGVVFLIWANATSAPTSRRRKAKNENADQTKVNPHGRL